jgi:hypothetical protein
MVLTPELRKVPRYEIILPLRIVSVGRQRVNLVGQTRDVGAGGVRFVVPDKLPIGRKVEYIITRSSGNRGTEIECVGNILRCVKKYDYPSYEVVASIESERTTPQSDSSSLSEMLDDLSPPAQKAHSSSSRLSSALDTDGSLDPDRSPDMDRSLDVDPDRSLDVDLDRYRPMLRLLSEEDEELVADPALRRKLRTQRYHLFREYLRSLTEDYRATLAGVRLLMAQSNIDRPDLAKALVRNRVSFAIVRCRIEVRLRLYTLGVRNTDVLKLEVQGLARALEVLQRQFSFLAESAAWGS